MFTPQTRLPDLDDTIVALSSAVGPAARAIVRLSGRRSFAIVAALSSDFTTMPSGHFTQAKMRLPGFHAPIAADVYHFAAPRTYTGQDVVEIHLISCKPIIEALIAACLDAGARAAQPGEFTMRGFLAGKLDLTRAEAVLGVIEASDRHDLQQALKQLAGGLAEPMRTLREDLLNLLADVEAGLDFLEEDIHFVAADDILLRLGKGLAHLTLLRRQIDQRALGQRPFRVVLAGRPNAGKSSLFNALLGKDAALVSAEPGTTRDYLQAVVTIDGIPIELIDTAGVRETGQAIEASAQALGKEQVREADLVVRCVACDWVEDGLEIRPAVEFAIATKADLAPPRADMLATSASTGLGLAALRRHLAAAARRASRSALAPSLSRCRHHVEACWQYLQNAHAIVLDDGLPELLAMDLRLALDELGAMSGAVYTDDLLDRIFSRFCIGK